MSEEKKKNILNSAAHFLSGTMLSRLSGVLRDIVMAASFGSHPSLAALMMAFRFSYLLRRLFGDGAMHSAFVPQYESSHAISPARSASFFQSLWLVLTLFLSLIVVLAELLFFALRPYLCVDSREVLELTMLLFPSIIFICSYALNSSLLQCQKRYFLPAFAPCVFNLVWVFAAYSLKDQPTKEAMPLMALYLLLAAMLQCFITLVPVLRYLKSFTRSFVFHDVKKILRPLFWAILGMGATQINSAVDSLFARYADLRGPAYLWYAIRIQQFPLAIVGLALSQALLPPLSREAPKKDSAFFELLEDALEKSFQGTFVFFCLFFVLAGPMIQCLYGRGDFSELAAAETMQCLWAYLLGLIPSVWIHLLATAFYAQKNYQSPMYGSLYAVVSNLFLNSIMIFVWKMDATSVALATSISAFVNLFYLARQEKKIYQIMVRTLTNNRGFILSLFLIASLTALFAAYFFNDQSLWLMQVRRQSLSFSLFALTVQGSFFASLLALLYLFQKFFKAGRLLHILKKTQE